MVFSLDDFRYQEEATLEIVPPGGPEPIATITFAGPAHPQTRALAERQHYRAGRVSMKSAIEPQLSRDRTGERGRAGSPHPRLGRH